jgi:hypothetical protein
MLQRLGGLLSMPKLTKTGYEIGSSEAGARILDNIAEQDVNLKDAQAVLWFYEQNLFTDLGVISRPGSFTKAAETISNDL